MEDRQRKQAIAKIGTVVVAAAILSLWLVNLRNVRGTLSDNQGDATAANWEELKIEMDNSLQEIRRRLDEEKSASSSPINVDLDSARRATVKDILSETAAIASSSSPVSPDNIASTTPQTPTSPKDSASCPEWINCMPSIGDASRSCVVPLGCEGITQIAY